MHEQSRRLCAFLVVLGLVLVVSERVAAQPAKMAEVKKEDFRATTVDGVRLVGDFYPPQPKDPAKTKVSAGREAPCVILLHGKAGGGKNGNRKDFGRLPARLAEEGYAVLAFDFRGHGESTAVEPHYWTWYPHRQGKTRKKITTKDFKNQADYLGYGDDLMEAKLFLNRLSEQTRCNSQNIILIGADEGAVAGLLWVGHGLSGIPAQLPPTSPNQVPPWSGPRVRVDNKLEGEDVTCVIWLSMQRASLGGTPLERAVRRSLELIREKGIATLALYGDQDRISHSFWDRYFKVIKPTRDKDLYETTALKRIDKTSLVGTKLLGSDALKTEELIFEYLGKANVVKKQPWQRKSDMELQQNLFAIDRMIR